MKYKFVQIKRIKLIIAQVVLYRVSFGLNTITGHYPKVEKE
jgi:hypothetical protein